MTFAAGFLLLPWMVLSILLNGVALLQFFGVWWLSEHSSRGLFFGLVSLQLIFNLGVVVARGIITGARF